MWLPLTDYSIKHKVSISTLRRKIKASDIQYRLDDGKYLILDSGFDLNNHVGSANEHRPSLMSDFGLAAQQPENKTTEQVRSAHVFEPALKKQTESALATATESGESVITAANRLLTDLKKAYTQVLQDKEVQILSLIFLVRWTPTPTSLSDTKALIPDS